MSIDATATVVLGAVLAVSATLIAACLWDRARAVGRTLLTFLVVLLLSVTCALQLNRLTVAYPTWSALVGGPSREVALSSGLRTRPGGGRLLTVTVPGRASGLTLTMGVYLPAAYDTPEGAGRRFPVIEMLHGYPGSPSTWVRRLKVVQHLDEEIIAGRMAPAVVLLPYQTPKRLLDTECTNLADGPQTETFLTEDVAAYAADHYRVRTDSAGWGLIGYSAGGFCAMNLALRHPHRYAAAASLSGDAGPGIAVGDGSENTTNNVAWRLQHLPQPPLSFYVAWAADDRESRDGSRAVVRLARPPLRVTAVELPSGGHSHALWRRMESPALDWLSGQLARSIPIDR
ncbi:alpha/beta hydrolase-fold protein [Actinoplanes sp. NPDC049316]|uniref:alpha/beta hydrolase n=1 Tax=Actinoplanes sp. NPDC049316 TaxID=3154727 RepID=UPI003444AF6E